MRNTKERCDGGVSARLLNDAFSSIYQNQRQTAGRSSCNHVAGILHVTRRICNDETSTRRSKVPIGNIDCDALLTFGPQPVGKLAKLTSDSPRIELALFKAAY